MTKAVSDAEEKPPSVPVRLARKFSYPKQAPPIILPQRAIRIVASLAVSRSFFRHLKELLPTVEVIDRDYSHQLVPIGGLRRTQVGGPPMVIDEADIAVTTKIGVILTSLIHIRQRPLPGVLGGVPKSLLRRRIEAVAKRYDHVIILAADILGGQFTRTLPHASSGSNNSSNIIGARAAGQAQVHGGGGLGPDEVTYRDPLPDADIRALGDLDAFVKKIKTDVQLVYVGGGDESLAMWVRLLACDYGGQHEMQKRLVTIEQPCEVMMRRCGMNAFAAQVVLSALQWDMASERNANPEEGEGEGDDSFSSIESGSDEEWEVRQRRWEISRRLRDSGLSEYADLNFGRLAARFIKMAPRERESWLAGAVDAPAMLVRVNARLDGTWGDGLRRAMGYVRSM